MLPDFIGLGAQKAGTTSLFHYLQGHPDICMASRKETSFFYKDALFSKGLKYYEETFSVIVHQGRLKVRYPLTTFITLGVLNDS